VSLPFDRALFSIGGARNQAAYVLVSWLRTACQAKIELQAYIEGPYGAPMIDTLGTRYKCFLIVASGLGWTFLRAWKRQLLQEAVRARPVKSIRSIAIMKHKDRHLLEEFYGWEGGVEDQQLPSGVQLLVCI
jgi:hypothetical protein